MSLRYRLHKNQVLRNISFSVKHGEKVAIVGRTGSGKSSLYNALTGLYAVLDTSDVVIDGTKLPMHNTYAPNVNQDDESGNSALQPSSSAASALVGGR